jgi:ribosome modulation factor
MAESVSADSNPRRRRKDSGGDLPEHDPSTAPAPKTLPNLATEADMQRFFAIVKNAERSYDSFLADQRTAKVAAKSTKDKALTDAADAMKSRGITKQIFRELYEESNRKEEEVTARMQAKLWGMRALGMSVGVQAEMEFNGNDEALRRARQQGYDAFTDKKPDSANPYGPSSAGGQKWLEGYNQAGADMLLEKAN